MAIRRDFLVERYPVRIRLFTSCVLLLVAGLFYLFPRYIQDKTAIQRSDEKIIETLSIPATNQFLIPPPTRPSIPIESHNEEFAENISIEEADLEYFYWSPPPPMPEEEPDIPIIPYDEPPEPIGGYAAIGRLARYPDAARALGIEGSVIVQAFIDANGRVMETIILEDVPNSGFGKAASAAIRESLFRPAKKHGEPVATWIVIPVNFVLRF